MGSDRWASVSPDFLTPGSVPTQRGPAGPCKTQLPQSRRQRLELSLKNFTESLSWRIWKVFNYLTSMFTFPVCFQPFKSPAFFFLDFFLLCRSDSTLTPGPLEIILCSQSCPTLCDPMGCSLPGSSVHGILQARILEWVAIPFSRASSQPGDQTWVSHIAGRFFTVWTTREAQIQSPETKSYLRRSQWLWQPLNSMMWEELFHRKLPWQSSRTMVHFPFMLFKRKSTLKNTK